MGEVKEITHMGLPDLYEAMPIGQSGEEWSGASPDAGNNMTEIEKDSLILHLLFHTNLLTLTTIRAVCKCLFKI